MTAELVPCPVCDGLGGWIASTGQALREPDGHRPDDGWHRCPYCRGERRGKAIPFPLDGAR